jgi:transposase
MAFGASTALRFLAMRLITLLNHCERFPGFVYVKARLAEQRTIEIDVRPRRGSKPLCSICHQRGPVYDHLSVRRFDFVPIWGFIVLLDVMSEG